MSDFTQSIYYEQCIRPHLLIFEFMYFHALHHAFILFIVLLDKRLGPWQPIPWSCLHTVLELVQRPHEVFRSTSASSDPTLWFYVTYHFMTELPSFPVASTFWVILATKRTTNKWADMPNKSHKITKANLLAVQELFITSHHSCFAHHVLQHVKLQMVRLMFCFLFSSQVHLGIFIKCLFFPLQTFVKVDLSAVTSPTGLLTTILKPQMCHFSHHRHCFFEVRSVHIWKLACFVERHLEPDWGNIPLLET